MMSQGFVPGYSEAKLEEIEESMAPWRRTYLSRSRIEDEARILLWRRPGGELEISRQVFNFYYGRTGIWFFSLFMYKKVNAF